MCLINVIFICFSSRCWVGGSVQGAVIHLKEWSAGRECGGVVVGRTTVEAFAASVLHAGALFR